MMKRERKSIRARTKKNTQWHRRKLTYFAVDTLPILVLLLLSVAGCCASIFPHQIQPYQIIIVYSKHYSNILDMNVAPRINIQDYYLARYDFDTCVIIFAFFIRCFFYFFFIFFCSYTILWCLLLFFCRGKT